MQPGYRPFAQPLPHSQRSPHAVAGRRGIGPMIAGAHPQNTLTSHQAQQQLDAQRKATEDAKRRSRRPTDKNIPDGVEDCVIGDGVGKYRDLRDVESRLDATMMRKRLDIQDSQNRSLKRYRTLRVWISNTVEDQPWQGEEVDEDPFDFSTNMDSSYRVRIEGRLLDDDDEVQDDDEEDDAAVVVAESGLDPMDEDGEERKPKRANPDQQYKFSHFFKSMNVEFERSRTKDGAEHIVEWKKPAIPPNAGNPPNAADFDLLEFKRGGDENMNITINLVRDESQEQFALSPSLFEIIDTKTATRAEVVTGIWEYIRIMGLQEDDEKRSFRCDEILKMIFNRELMTMPEIPELTSPLLSPLPPIKLHYTIRVDQEFHKAPLATIYDLLVTIDDPLRAKLLAFNTNPTYPSTLREISVLNDQLAILIQAIASSKAKHNFFTTLSRDPGTFLRKWISSQKRDLEVLRGDAVRGAAEDATGEEWRRGGPRGVWGTESVRESVNLLLAARPKQI